MDSTTPQKEQSLKILQSGLFFCRGSNLDKKKYLPYNVYAGSGTLWYTGKDSLTPNDPIDIIPLHLATVKETDSSGKKSEHKFTLCIEKSYDKIFNFQMSLDSKEDSKVWFDLITRLISSASPQLFETTLEDSAYKTNQIVPSFITYIADQMMPHVSQEGVFRVSGNQNMISDFKSLYNEGILPDMSNCDIHLLGGVLKVYFRELSSPVIPHEAIEELTNFKDINNSDSLSSHIKSVLSQLPTITYTTVGYMMKFLKKVSLKVSSNKMDANNLAIVFAPSFLRVKSGKDELSLMGAANKVCERMISDADNIFNNVTEESAKKPLRANVPEKFNNEKPEYTLTEKPLIEQVLNLHHEDLDDVVFCRVLRVTPKTNALDEIVLVIGNNRIYGFGRGGKLEFETHYLDLLEVSSPSESYFNISYGLQSKPNVIKFRPISYHSTDVNVIVKTVIEKLQHNYAGAFEDHSLWCKVDVLPLTRKNDIINAIQYNDHEEGCGGYVQTYRSICDYYSIPVLEDLIWDMENLFFNNDIKSYNVSECVKKDRYPNDDFKALIHALHYNNWFTSFVADNQKIGNDCIQMVANIFKTNKTITSLSLAQVGGTGSSFSSLADSFLLNPTLSLNELNFSGNNLDDKTAEKLGLALEKFSALYSLNISNCSVGKKGMVALLESIQKSPKVCQTLQVLDISGNNLDNQDCSRKLGLVLGKAVELKTLNLANTQPNFIHICAAFQTSNVQLLNVSDTKIGKQQSDVVDFMKRFPKVTDLIISNFPIPVKSLTDILKAQKEIKVIDISDYDLTDENVVTLSEYLLNPTNNVHLEELNMNRMFGRRSKDRNLAINSVASILDTRPIKKLRLKGGAKSQLKSDLLPLILSLINNKHLKLLDISGNQCGDSLAIAFAKVLQHNKTVDTLYWDDNGTTMSGLKQFKIGLERNRTIKKMSLPLIDISNILKVETDLTTVIQLTSEIQEIVFDNANDPLSEESSSFRKKEELNEVLIPTRKKGTSIRSSRNSDKKGKNDEPNKTKGHITRANVTRASLILTQSIIESAKGEFNQNTL